MRILFFFFISFFIASCGTEATQNASSRKPVIVQAEIPMPLYSGEVSFNDYFETRKTFLNGEPIPHAQSKKQWSRAAEEGTSAWCYVDSVKKQGVLYNAFCLRDERGLLKADSLINEIDAAIFVSMFDAPEVQELDLHLTERNYLGNFYQLGFHNIWVHQNGTDLGMNYILSYQPDRAQVQLRKSHPGSGYFIRTLKK